MLRQACGTHWPVWLLQTVPLSLHGRQSQVGTQAPATQVFFGPQLMAWPVLGSLQGSMQMPPEQTVGGGQRMPSQALTQVPPLQT